MYSCTNSWRRPNWHGSWLPPEPPSCPTGTNPGLRQRLCQLFAAHGVDPARLELQGPCFHADLLAAYGQVDIALDPFPFNGGLTSCEALWLGLPLVSLAGEDRAAVMATHQGMAMLQLIGQPEWIAENEAQYMAIAAALAADLPALQQLRYELRAVSRPHRSAMNPPSPGPF